jgi:hypothetical protein
MQDSQGSSAAGLKHKNSSGAGKRRDLALAFQDAGHAIDFGKQRIRLAQDLIGESAGLLPEAMAASFSPRAASRGA